VAGDEMRRRIERNLHDGVQQRLVTLSLRLHSVRDRVPDGLPAIRDDLSQLADVLAETLEEIRDLARGVHPAILVEAGLSSALHGLAQRSTLPVRLHMHADGRVPQKPRQPRTTSSPRPSPTPSSMPAHRRSISGSR
jgi:signal transduction histidine kinase